MWHSLDAAYVVEFTYGSPFKEGDTFHVPAEGNKPSGPLKEDALGMYHYSVTGTSGVLDPKIFVDP